MLSKFDRILAAFMAVGLVGALIMAMWWNPHQTIVNSLEEPIIEEFAAYGIELNEETMDNFKHIRGDKYVIQDTQGNEYVAEVVFIKGDVKIISITEITTPTVEDNNTELEGTEIVEAKDGNKYLITYDENGKPIVVEIENAKE